MEEEKAIGLINKYNRAELTPEQERRLNEWYLLTVAESKAELKQEQILRIVDAIRPALPLQAPVKKIILWPRIAAVAAVVLMVIGAYFFLTNSDHSTQQFSASQDIAPGKTGATLTLANGVKIKLGNVVNGEIAKQSGITIRKTASGQLVYEMGTNGGIKADHNAINKLSTAIGETYEVRLPDGSRVWLNGGSSLTYTPGLTAHGQRRVMLTGEGYFEIAKNKSLPFVVETNTQLVTVMGTHFNINSYPDEPVIKTTLIEGSVRVASNKIQVDAKVLKPGQQSSLNKNGDINVQSADVAEAIAWKEGYFRFNDEPIQGVMRKLSRWYNIEVHYEGTIPDEKFNGKLSRNINISQALKALESTKTIHFKIEGRRVTVIQ